MRNPTISIQNISARNQALGFIEDRIADNNYRGTASSQHNRYDMAEIRKTLTILAQFTQNDFLRIRDTDTSKRPLNTREEADYADFTEAVKASVGKGTQDSIRKNIFPDLVMMGFIHRFDKDRNLISGLGKASPKYVALTEDGLNFINEKNIVNRLFRYTKGVYQLNPQIAYILEILRNPDYAIDELDIWEIMFFVSAIDTETSFAITTDECVSLINAWRLLGTQQKNSAIYILKTQMQPENYGGDKTEWRDFGNWKNKIEQIFYLLRENAYFRVENYKMSLSSRKYENSGEQIIKKRSRVEQKAYYRAHKLNKRENSDLHHIVALMLAQSPAQYNLYDKWQNMIEVRGDKHNIIGRKYKNMVFILSADGNNLILKDYLGHEMLLEYDRDINYNPELQQYMLDYNSELIHSV